jgi:hypothetical protein
MLSDAIENLARLDFNSSSATTAMRMGLERLHQFLATGDRLQPENFY